MSEATATPARRPLFFAAAIAAGLAILPLFMLFDRLNAGDTGGDGLQGFWTAVFIFAGGVVASIACIIGGLVRGERPRWLIPLTLASWLAPVFVLMI